MQYEQLLRREQRRQLKQQVRRPRMAASNNLKQWRMWFTVLVHLLLWILTAEAFASITSKNDFESRAPRSAPSAALAHEQGGVYERSEQSESVTTVQASAGVVEAAVTAESKSAVLAASESSAFGDQAATPSSRTSEGVVTAGKVSEAPLGADNGCAAAKAKAEGEEVREKQAVQPSSGERPLPVSPGLAGRLRPLSAPFVRHYSKHMAILWEWYTKTIGATMNGKRKQDEDALVVHAPAHWKPNVRFKAIFDGHGGSAVSRTCVAQFCNYFGNMPDLSPETFKRTSLLLDAVIRSDPVRHERGGSTGLVVAIERPDEQIPKFKVYASNIGDSRAFILHRNGSYTIMSKDHKPSDPEEVARISRAGGFVARVRKVFRVDGILSVSRAFGDIRMKGNPYLSVVEQKVVAVPDVRIFEAAEGDYIFMACDGMFEAPGMTWDFVANLLHRELQNTKDNLVETAFRMLNTAYLLGSADNISIVLTKLMNRKRSSSVVKRFTYDFSGKREFVETQLLTSPNEYRSGTYHTPGGPVVTLF